MTEDNMTVSKVSGLEREIDELLRQAEVSRAVNKGLGFKCGALRRALEEIAASHLGDCPAAMDEVDFARAHNSRVRRIARDALKESA